MSWSFFVSNAEPIARYASGAVALLGFLACLLVTLRWRWVERHYREVVAKVAVAVFRAVAAGSAILSRTSPSEPGDGVDRPWVSTTAVAIVGYLLWELAGVIGDSKSKSAKEKRARDHELEIEALTKGRDDAVFEASRLEWLLAHLREPVGHKLQRVRRVVESSSGSRASVQQLREGLAPDSQIRITLEYLAGLFRVEVISTGGTITQNFRVGLYVEEDGRLEPRDAFNLATKSHTPFATPLTHPERFRLDATVGPSHAVRCVREGRTLIVPDCRTDPGFQYIGEAQENYLLSMVAYPLTDCRPDGIHPVRAALLIDTDVPGFFQKEDQEVIESRIHEFALRIELEYAIRGLLT